MEVKTLLIKDIRKAGSTISLKAKVQDLYPARHPKIKQVGILKDKTGRIKFVNWTNANQPEVRKDIPYLFKNVQISHYEKTGRLEVHLTGNTELFRLVKKTPSSLTKEVTLPPSRKIIEARAKKPYPRILPKKPKPVILPKPPEPVVVRRKPPPLNLQITAYVAIVLLCVAGIATFVNHLIVESKARIWPKTDDVIQFETASGNVPFRVTGYNVEEKAIKLVSLDEYQEEIEFKEQPHLTPVQDEEVTFDSSSIKVDYSYQFEQYGDHVSPDIFSTVIHVNSERDEAILKKLPGIGVKGVIVLKIKRPFKNLQEVMDAGIGVGRVWAGEWQIGIENETIIFD